MKSGYRGHPVSFDFNERPFLVIWETTHACDLACIHCRASAEPEAKPGELTHDEALDLIRQVREMNTPILIFSGGDPLKRKDLPELIRYAQSLGLRTGAIPAGSPLLTDDRIREFQTAGLDQIAFSLDAANAADHDAFRKVEGVFDRTLKSIATANRLGLAVQINSLINLHNLERLEPLIELVRTLDIVFWEVFFLVPLGRGNELTILSGAKFEEAFEKIYALNKQSSFVIKVTEAPHYRRFCIEKEMVSAGLDPRTAPLEKLELPEYLRKVNGPRRSIGHAPQGVNSGKGFLFISCEGEIMPSGFLPISAGHMRRDRLADVYRQSQLFKTLRDTSLLKGRCGICAYKDICGGSRSRAYAMIGDYLAEDPCCAYQPAEKAVVK